MVLLNICFLRFLKSSSLKSPLVNKCPENVKKCDTELTKQLLVKIFSVYVWVEVVVRGAAGDYPKFWWLLHQCRGLGLSWAAAS